MSQFSWARWNKWVEQNARPKPEYRASFRPEPTRWQKPGPMHREDWVKFHKWCLVNAASQEASNTVPLPRVTITAMENPSKSPRTNRGRTLGAGTNTRSQLRETLSRLSQPRWQRYKYDPPPKEEFSFRPHLSRRRKPRPERGRPVEKPKVPCCFQHEDLRAEFWANVRFPISKRAQRALPSRQIWELSRPRTAPAKPHCPLPVKLEDMPPKRTKMSHRQWRDHLHRLEYLAKPNPRVLAEMPTLSYVYEYY